MQPIVALTPDELLKLLAEAKKHSTRAHAMVLMACRHGLRCSEICGLRMEHLNMREGWVRCVRLKNSLTTVQPLETQPGEPLLNEVRVLNAYLRTRVDDGSGVVFTSTHGGAMDRSSFYRLWRHLAQAAGLPASTHHPHCAKHFLGALLARSGANAFAIRQALGHRSISSSMVYCTVGDAEAGRVAKQAFMQTF